MRDKVILHCDLNSFYASVVCLYHPEVRGKPVAVGGDVKNRHGIILAKNPEAKKYGIETGEVLWQAKKKCPGLIIFPPNYPLYLRYSECVRDILQEYTDFIEPFGIDEAWMDVSGSEKLFGSGERIADELRKRIKEELGVSVSVGVSWNKIYAKLASDYRKPDATTVIRRDNVCDIVYPLPVSDLLYVGKRTAEILHASGIDTIGDLARADPVYLRENFGKNAALLQKYASGQDDSPVRNYRDILPPKSVGSSITCKRDLNNMDDVKTVVYLLSESIASRLRAQSMEGCVIQVSCRQTNLKVSMHQMKLPCYTNLSKEIAQTALSLFHQLASPLFPLRSIGIAVSHLHKPVSHAQLSLYIDEEKREKERKLDTVMEVIRNRYGSMSVQRAVLLCEPQLSGFYPESRF